MDPEILEKLEKFIDCKILAICGTTRGGERLVWQTQYDLQKARADLLAPTEPKE